jgi:uncharacterized protein involved in exopolysaccharide biosynthesis
MLPHNTERNRQPAMAGGSQTQARGPIESEREALSAILGNLRRNTRVIAVTTLVGVSIVTALVTFGLTPQYMATTTILVDSRKTQETPGIEAKILGAVMNRVQDDFARNCPEYGSFHKVA